MENNVVKVHFGMEYKHRYRLLDSKMDIIKYKLLGLTHNSEDKICKYVLHPWLVHCMSTKLLVGVG